MGPTAESSRLVDRTFWSGRFKLRHPWALFVLFLAADQDVILMSLRPQPKAKFLSAPTQHVVPALRPVCLASSLQLPFPFILSLIPLSTLPSPSHFNPLALHLSLPPLFSLLPHSLSVRCCGQTNAHGIAVDVQMHRWLEYASNFAVRLANSSATVHL